MGTSEQTTEWHAKASTLPIDGRAVINGDRVNAMSGKTFANVNPATGLHLADVAEGSGADVDAAVTSARRAFDSGVWSRADASERKTKLLKLAELIEARSEEFALLDSLDMGKPVSQSFGVDVPDTVENFRWYAEAIDKLNAEIPATPYGSTAMVTKEPLGVIGVIVPWNYPLEIASWKLAPALATGNSVVLKPATQSSLSALLLGQVAIEAGIPAGVLNVIPGPGNTVGAAIGLHPDIDALTFTGSTLVAKQLLGYAGQSNMKRLSLEAGGKSANVIFADATDIQLAAEKAAFGAFYNQGEVCSATSRIFVERSIYDDFARELIKAAREYEPGDPLHEQSGNGSLVSTQHADKVEAAIASARESGEILAGGDRLTITGSTAYIRPTIIGSLEVDHPVNRNEIFGPVATISTFDTEQEAIMKANATDYGLAASLWTSDLSRAYRVSAALRAGTVSINTVDALGVTTPFGGFKQSGFGRDLSIHAIDNYVGLKTTWIQHG